MKKLILEETIKQSAKAVATTFTNKINELISARLPKKEYVAYITQASTDAPSVTLIKDNIGLGAVTAERTDFGIYTLTFANPGLATSKTDARVQTLADATAYGVINSASATSTTILTIKTYDAINGATLDDLLNGNILTITVYE